MVSPRDVQLVSEINESDCCGNGCVNCILNVKPRDVIEIHEIGKRNLILNYSKYKLINRNTHQPHLLQVLEMHFVCADVSKTADHVLYIPAGHHIMMRAPVPCNAEKQETKSVLRPYSPYWVNAETLEFKILVNLKPNGPMSNFLAELRQGDEVECRGPLGSFKHVADAQTIYYILTQGVAIAPSVRVIEEVLADDEDESRIFLFACFQNMDHILFRDRLQEFSRFWNFKSRIYLSHQKCGSAACDEEGCTEQCEEFQKRLRYKESVYPRRLDVKDLEDHCRNLTRKNKVFLLCGSRQFQDHFADLIKTLDIIDVDHVKTYKF